MQPNQFENNVTTRWEKYQVHSVVLVPHAAVEQRLQTRLLHRPLAAPQARKELLAALPLEHVGIRLHESAHRPHGRQSRRLGILGRGAVFDLQHPGSVQKSDLFSFCSTC